MIVVFAATVSGDVKRIDQLLTNLKPDLINATDHRGRTALHLAVEHGHSEVVERLIGHGINLAAEDCGGFTALHLAAELGHEKILAMLLEKSPELADARGTNGVTYLHLAAINGHVAVAKQLLATNFKLINMEDKFDNPPLYYAVEYGQTEVVTTLLESVKSRNDEKKKMLYFAITSGYDPIASHILAQSPELMDAVLTREFAPLLSASQSAVLFAAQCGRRHFTDGLPPLAKSVLHLAAECGRRTIVDQLLAAKPLDSIHVGGSYKRSLLHFGAQYGIDWVVARLIVEKPHLIDILDSSNESVLHLAAAGGHHKIMAQLLAVRPTLASLRDSDQETALHLAARCGHDQAVKLLLTLRPDQLDLSNLRGETPLRMAAQSGRHKVVACLLAYRAQADAEMLWDSFHPSGKRAVGGDSSRDEAIKLLLAYNPELIWSVNGRYDTLLHHVFHRSMWTRDLFSEDMMRTIWQLYPQALRQCNSEQMTPFHVAVFDDNKFAIELVQWKLSLDEIVHAFDKHRKVCPESLLDQIRDCLLKSLHKDVVWTVYEYLGFRDYIFKKTYNPAKIMRDWLAPNDSDSSSSYLRNTHTYKRKHTPQTK